MRDFLFRAKRIDNNEWVEGLFVHMNDDPEMWVSFTDEEMERYKGHFLEKIRGVWVKIHRNSIGQFTGLLDKNRTMIFEGDIIQYANDIRYEVLWNNTHLCYWVRGINDDDVDVLSNLYGSEIDILGNIYDNPELLEVNQ